VFYPIDLILSVPHVTRKTLIASKHFPPRDYKCIELTNSELDVIEVRSHSYSSGDNYRHILNTKRDHLISITHVNDTLVAELISSGVINAESDFTQTDVRWDSLL
jgi:hypothetical protein